MNKGWKIGSCKFGRISYERDEHFFTPDDIPKKKLQAYKDMKEFTDPDILDLKKKDWNLRSSIPRQPVIEETFERKIMRVMAFY